MGSRNVRYTLLNKAQVLLRAWAERRIAPKGKSPNPGGRPKALGELQELAMLDRTHAKPTQAVTQTFTRVDPRKPLRPYAVSVTISLRYFHVSC